MSKASVKLYVDDVNFRSTNEKLKNLGIPSEFSLRNAIAVLLNERSRLQIWIPFCLVKKINIIKKNHGFKNI